jgi:cell division septation protein DedD
MTELSIVDPDIDPDTGKPFDDLAHEAGLTDKPAKKPRGRGKPKSTKDAAPEKAKAKPAPKPKATKKPAPAKKPVPKPKAKAQTTEKKPKRTSGGKSKKTGFLLRLDDAELAKLDKVRGKQTRPGWMMAQVQKGLGKV